MESEITEINLNLRFKHKTNALTVNKITLNLIKFFKNYQDDVFFKITWKK